MLLKIDILKGSNVQKGMNGEGVTLRENCLWIEHADVRMEEGTKRQICLFGNTIMLRNMQQIPVF